MSVLYLVRHGQASFGTEDYDRLSTRGKDQSHALGTSLRRSGMLPARITSGAMKRQLQTARYASGAADWGTPLDTDPGWDEFNAAELINALPEDDPDAKTDSRAFQRLLEKASTRWASGGHDADYSETFGEFTRRIDGALDRAVDSLRSGESAVVVSSSGAIAWAAARLLDGGFPQWLALNRVTVNSGVTKIVSGSSGKTLVAFNEHGHLPRSWITYR
ncbi:histidine phosphatase family protein [Arthrobacter sp. I2-34]|uniref:Histidine phosphatase family protein n=1 Tax=Arthrobacter hankyongi TaxID=2904801 RepID=A0ABS9L946_9MICC|nr:histidine phosphatase family protein [Arthrobacter hankyongi]MCG2623121.1 histidine phosphatase family protein [Arthrobacter hankyongi]